jgi:hypothetical protein
LRSARMCPAALVMKSISSDTSPSFIGSYYPWFITIKRCWFRKCATLILVVNHSKNSYGTYLFSWRMKIKGFFSLDNVTGAWH